MWTCEDALSDLPLLENNFGTEGMGYLDAPKNNYQKEMRKIALPFIITLLLNISNKLLILFPWYQMEATIKICLKSFEIHVK